MSKYYFEIGTIMMKVMRKILAIDTNKIQVTADKEGFSIRESFFIAELGEQGFMTFNELEKKLDVDRKTLIALIGRLHKKRIIEKTLSEEDKRRFHIRLTDKGERVREELLEHASHLMRFAVDDLTINEEKAVLKFFSKMLQTTVTAPEIESFNKKHI